MRSIKFNRTLYRREVIATWREFAIGSGVSLLATLILGWLAFAVADWILYPAIFFLVVFLYCFFAGLLVAIPMSIDYHRRHVSGRFTPKKKRDHDRDEGGDETVTPTEP